MLKILRGTDDGVLHLVQNTTFWELPKHRILFVEFRMMDKVQKSFSTN
jgi:hypothetical protein